MIRLPTLLCRTRTKKRSAEGSARQDRVVLYFYPRADTPGCTIEACEFRDTYKRMQKSGAVLLGISPDTSKAQKKFQDKFSLPFTLLADADKKVAEAFGVMKEKKHAQGKSGEWRGPRSSSAQKAKSSTSSRR